MGIMELDFVNGIVKSMEGKLVSFDTFSRMIDSPSGEEALQILREKGFGAQCEAETPRDFEKLIRNEEEALKAFYMKYCPNEKLLRCLLAKFDFKNAEAVVRGKFYGETEKMLTLEGAVKIEDLKKSMGEDGIKNIPDYLESPMRESLFLLEGNQATGIKVSTIFLRAYYEYVLKNSPFGVYKNLLKNEIDAKNISIALRSEDYETAKEMFIKGGNISLDDFKVLAEHDHSKINSRFFGTPSMSLIEIALEEKKSGKPLIRFEREASDYPLKRLDEKKYTSEGLYPLVLYWAYRQAEFANVRIVMVGKNASLDKEYIRMRLRYCYGR